MFDIVYIAVFTVGFLDDYVFQGVDVVVQEGGLFFYFQRFFVPRSSFFGILTVEVGQFLVEDIVLQRSIRSRPFQSVFNMRFIIFCRGVSLLLFDAMCYFCSVSSFGFSGISTGAPPIGLYMLMVIAVIIFS